MRANNYVANVGRMTAPNTLWCHDAAEFCFTECNREQRSTSVPRLLVTPANIRCPHICALSAVVSHVDSSTDRNIELSGRTSPYGRQFHWGAHCPGANPYKVWWWGYLLAWTFTKIRLKSFLKNQ